MFSPLHVGLFDFFFSRFYMSFGDTGLVLEVLSHPDETDDILVLKKSIASAFSHHKQVVLTDLTLKVLVATIDAQWKGMGM